MNCCVIIHSLEVSCKEDQLTSAQRLHVFVTSFMRQNDVTPSNVINDVTFDCFSVVNDVKAARAFKTVTLLFNITRFFNIGYIGEVCSNVSCVYVIKHSNTPRLYSQC